MSGHVLILPERLCICDMDDICAYNRTLTGVIIGTRVDGRDRVDVKGDVCLGFVGQISLRLTHNQVACDKRVTTLSVMVIVCFRDAEIWGNCSLWETS